MAYAGGARGWLVYWRRLIREINIIFSLRAPEAANHIVNIGGADNERNNPERVEGWRDDKTFGQSTGTAIDGPKGEREIGLMADQTLDQSQTLCLHASVKKKQQKQQFPKLRDNIKSLMEFRQNNKYQKLDCFVL